MNPVAGVRSTGSGLNWLYKVSNAAAMIVGVLFLIAGVYLIIKSPQLGINDWLLLLENNWIVLLFKLHFGISGVQLDQLYVLNLLDIVIMVFVAIAFLGLCTALRRDSKIWSIIALVQPFLGIIIFIVTKSAGRSTVMGAVLVMSFVMLRNNTFSNATACVGILASLLLLIGDTSVSIIRSSTIAILHRCRLYSLNNVVFYS